MIKIWYHAIMFFRSQLDYDGNTRKSIWWNHPKMNLFSLIGNQNKISIFLRKCFIQFQYLKCYQSYQNQFCLLLYFWTSLVHILLEKVSRGGMLDVHTIIFNNKHVSSSQQQKPDECTHNYFGQEQSYTNFNIIQD